jgi:hypothetical protein
MNRHLTYSGYRMHSNDVSKVVYMRDVYYDEQHIGVGLLTYFRDTGLWSHTHLFLNDRVEQVRTTLGDDAHVVVSSMDSAPMWLRGS